MSQYDFPAAICNSLNFFMISELTSIRRLIITINYNSLLTSDKFGDLLRSFHEISRSTENKNLVDSCIFIVIDKELKHSLEHVKNNLVLKTTEAIKKYYSKEIAATFANAITGKNLFILNPLDEGDSLLEFNDYAASLLNLSSFKINFNSHIASNLFGADQKECYASLRDNILSLIKDSREALKSTEYLLMMRKHPGVLFKFPKPLVFEITKNNNLYLFRDHL